MAALNKRYLKRENFVEENYSSLGQNFIHNCEQSQIFIPDEVFPSKVLAYSVKYFLARDWSFVLVLVTSSASRNGRGS